MTGAWWRSVLVAALFALHPLRVESVAWISERKDVLSGLFFLLTLEAYRRWTVRPARGRYALVALSLALGLTSQADAGDDAVRAGAARRLAAGPAAGTRSLARLWCSRSGRCSCSPRPSAAMTLRFQRAAGAVDATVPLADRLANAALSCWRYVGMTLWPARLSPHYELGRRGPAGRDRSRRSAAIAVTLLALWRLRRRSPAAVGWLWYLGMLVPVLGLVQVGSRPAPTATPTCPASASPSPSPGRSAPGPPRRVRGARWPRPPRCVALAALGVATVRQVAVWRDTRTLYRHALRASGESVMVLNGLATACEADSRAGGGGRLPAARARAGAELRQHALSTSASRWRAWATRRARPGTSAVPRSWRRGAPTRSSTSGSPSTRWGTATRPRPASAAPSRWSPATPAPWTGSASSPSSPGASPRGGSGSPAPPARAGGRTWRSPRRCSRSRGRTPLAAEHLRQAVLDRPDAPDALNALGWLLATSPDPAVRDGAGAVRAATRAAEITGGRDPNVLDTRAAALAAAGSFAEAVEVARAAAELARRAGVDSLVGPIRARLALYRSGRAWVDSSRVTAASPYSRTTR